MPINTTVLQLKVWVKVGLHGGLDQGWVGSQFVVFTVFCKVGLHGGLDQGWVGSQFVVFTVFCGTGTQIVVRTGGGEV